MRGSDDNQDGNMKSLMIAALLTLLAGCADTIRSRSDYDRSQSFAQYHTFAWMAEDPIIAPAGATTQVSPLNRKRIVEAIERELGAKGFEKVRQGGAADFVVAYTVGARDRIDAQSYPAPYGGGAWRWGGPYFGREVDVRSYTEGTLAIDIFDGASHQPVWHGRAAKRITAEDVEHAADRIRVGVAMILKDFPPRT
jgi:hypothetical protein